MGSRADILFSMLGMSPGVITETIWALAHENPPIIPESIVVVTYPYGERNGLQRSFGLRRESAGWIYIDLQPDLEFFEGCNPPRTSRSA